MYSDVSCGHSPTVMYNGWYQEHADAQLQCRRERTVPPCRSASTTALSRSRPPRMDVVQRHEGWIVKGSLTRADRTLRLLRQDGRLRLTSNSQPQKSLLPCRCHGRAPAGACHDLLGRGMCSESFSSIVMEQASEGADRTADRASPPGSTFHRSLAVFMCSRRRAITIFAYR